MEIKKVHIPNARLVEGRSYPFRILKIVSLGPGEDWFVMQDPNGYKILVPENFYRQYGFKPGQTLMCRVDKINCNGRMFLEPEHPHYKEGETYDFELISKGRRKNIINQDERYFIVRDVFSNEWKVRTYDRMLWEDPPFRIPCKVRRIKKGKQFLIIAGEEVRHPDLKPGQIYPFTIVDETINPDDGHSYYILEDVTGSKHLLRKKYYMHYGFRKGQRIDCRVDKFASEGFYLLEPMHPCYETGNIYRFPVERVEELVFTDGFTQKVLVLTDCFGEEVKVFSDDKVAAYLLNKGSVEARVSRIRKSRLELEIDVSGFE